MKKIHTQKEMKEFIAELLDVVRNKTGCGIQYNNCPCNTCFHALNDLNGTDFKHIVWLIVLFLRGDYDKDEIISAIEEELKEGVEE